MVVFLPKFHVRFTDFSPRGVIQSLPKDISFVGELLRSQISHEVRCNFLVVLRPSARVPPVYRLHHLNLIGLVHVHVSDFLGTKADSDIEVCSDICETDIQK